MLQSYSHLPGLTSEWTCIRLGFECRGNLFNFLSIEILSISRRMKWQKDILFDMQLTTSGGRWNSVRLGDGDGVYSNKSSKKPITEISVWMSYLNELFVTELQEHIPHVVQTADNFGKCCLSVWLGNRVRSDFLPASSTGVGSGTGSASCR